MFFCDLNRKSETFEREGKRMKGRGAKKSMAGAMLRVRFIHLLAGIR
jgi:hypothetical protein